MINRMVLCFAVLGVVCGFVSAAPQKESLNDAVIAAAYVQTIAAAIEKGNWSTALTQAERGKEFSNVDSDLSYLLALTRYQQRQAKGSALRALDDGVRLAQWHIFSFEEAKLLEATILISLKEYSAALAALAMVRKSNLEARARLLALRGLGQTDLFLAVLSEALEQYPSDTGLVRILAETATGLQDKTTELMARVLWRLPVLSESDPELSFLLCPFIQDTAAAKRELEAYLSHYPHQPQALLEAIRLGIRDEASAVRELFQIQDPAALLILDRKLLVDIYGLLETEEGRLAFENNFFRFTGIVSEDRNFDLIPESFAAYKDGLPMGKTLI